MSDKPVLSFAFMDPPFENERTVTFFRLLDAALASGADVNVFAYEGAVALPFARQRPHGNGVHGRSVEEEAHPLTRDWILGLQQQAEQNGQRFTWINCGLCVDERGVEEAIAGCPKGSPADFWKAAAASTNTLVIATK